MKVFIISDIGAKGESVIPYGLNLGKHNEVEVEILHIIDPRSHKGVSSPYSDSQSITPGAKMTHDEIKGRDRKVVEKELDKLLSAEASRLNYPLKVNSTVETDSVETKLKMIFADKTGAVCVASADPENSMVTELSELVSIFGKLEVPLLIVPPGYAWREPAEISLYTDFSESSPESIKAGLKWFDAFPLTARAFCVVPEAGVEDMKASVESWEKTAGNIVPQSMVFRTDVVTGKPDSGAILGQSRKSAAGLVMVPKAIFVATEYKLKKNSERMKFVNELGMPVLIY